MTQPTSRKALLSAIFASLAHADSPASSQSTDDVGAAILSATQRLFSAPQIKQLLVSLHCIFPSQLLPALDLIERRRISKLAITPTTATQASERRSKVGNESSGDSSDYDELNCFYVEASSPRAGRFTQTLAIRSFYEVRLRAWSCSCAAFIFSALDRELCNPLAAQENTAQTMEDGSKSPANDYYGGLAVGDKHVPMCKHLLACLLVQSCPSLAGYVGICAATEQEAAAWAAGWTS